MPIVYSRNYEHVLNKLCQGYLREINDDEYMQRQYAHLDGGDTDG